MAMGAEALLLTAFVNTLFNRLASRDGDLFNYVRELCGVESELKKWENTLLMIQAVLNDAAEKQFTDRSGAIKIWLDDLRDLAYDVEDILDECAAEALSRKLKAEPDDDQASTSKVKKSLLACINCFDPSTAKFKDSMNSRIKSTTNRFQELCEKTKVIGLQGNTGGTSTAAAKPYRPTSSSVPPERVVYGRDEDKDNILKLMLSNEPSDSNIPKLSLSDEPRNTNFLVIPIVGMAGIGKTTLTRMVYHDKAIENFKFDIKVWVCVSDIFDIVSISKALLESITPADRDVWTLNEVQVKLRKAVAGKKVFLVFDDVWNEDSNLWDDLKAPFLAAAPNSTIIVTTRHSKVAKIVGRPIEHYHLKHLSDKHCWSLFLEHAFQGREIIEHQISEFRDKVVEKCGGLPLAAKNLGGLFRSNTDDVWADILNSNILNFPQQIGILPVLQVSYHYLPSHLKRCFSYCAIFPKNYEFKKEELVLLWIAEGIIQQSRNGMQLEDWGNVCFDDLVSRSIFQQSSNDSSKFIMHDLAHDLAQLVSGETICRLEDANKLARGFERIRHSSYIFGGFDDKNKFDIFYKVEYLRTFLPTPIRLSFDSGYVTYVVLHDLLLKLKKLRVLSLQRYHITQLPDSIKGLRLLRYLNLAGTMIKGLPEWTSSLLDLQILILRDCSLLEKLPSKMRNLINLRHLDLEGANALKEMPLGMKQLKNLQTLSNFIVGKGENASNLKDLKNLKFLRGELCISGLENLTDLKDATEAVLFEKLNLEALSLQWGSQFDNSRNQGVEETILDVLQPHKNIKRLKITYYGGAKFPFWIGDRSFSQMQVLTLENCKKCKTLPSLGLLGSLKHLAIKGMIELESIGCETYGEGCLKPFQSLETIHFENLEEWKYWDTNVRDNEHVEVFSRLRNLSIVGCPKLSGKLPELLPSLEILIVNNCAELVVSFSRYPMLWKLEIDECKGMTCSSSPIDSKKVKFMTISNSALHIHGCKGMLYDNSTQLLKSVDISNILEFRKVLKQGFQIVDTFAIGSIDQIKSWGLHGDFEFKKQVQGLHVLTFPGEVSIEENSLSLVSFPDINFLPNNLRSLFVGNNDTLKFFPEEMMGSNSQLERLYVENCNSLTFIARCKLPSSLKRLEIDNCQNLHCLVEDAKYAAAAAASSSSSSLVTLKYIKISNCPELTTISSRTQLLEALEYLSILDCPKLESLPYGLHDLSCLQEISVRNCPSLACFPEMGLPSIISTVSIGRCENLKALPDDMHKLNSLEQLGIYNCPSIVSFPAEGFPSSVTTLAIGDLKIYNSLIQWGLHRLTSLTHLLIYGGDNLAESFPDKELRKIMPASLSTMSIIGFQQLKTLSSMNFESSASLKFLFIFSCPKLKSFSKLGLPSSLLNLYMIGCPLLQEKCKRDEGKEWSKIAHIPCIQIGSEVI